MLVTPYIRLLFLGLLATLVPLVDAKGGGGRGGGHGGGKSSSKGSSKPKTKITKTIVYTGGSGHTECRDELTNQVVKCPPDSRKTGIIVGSVIGGVFGLLAIILLVYCFVKRRRGNKGKTATRSIEVPTIATAKQKEYKRISESSADTDLSKPKETV